MKIKIYAFTQKGIELAETIKSLLLKQEKNEVECHLERGALQTVGEHWKDTRVFIFIGAAGIAVRAISPFLQNKLTDPAVLVVDECGQFVIPILCGHFGGGNEFAKNLAELLEAQPVITTATDLHGKFAVDVFAAKNKLAIVEKERIKLISAAILQGKQVGICSEIALQGSLPDDLILKSLEEKQQFAEFDTGIYIGVKPIRPFIHTLHLIPKELIVGIGCRKGKTVQELRSFLEEIFRKQQLPVEQIRAIASIDLKQTEKGLIELAQQFGVPFDTFSAEQLKQAKGDFTQSQFVAETVGVDNVCERSAACAAGDEYDWVLRKYAKSGITMAIVRINACISF